MDVSLLPGIIHCGPIELRPFTSELSDTLLALRNHPDIRKGMRNPAPIAWSDHQRFVASNLGEHPNQYVFLVYRSDQPMGLTLLRDDGESDVEIGVMIRRMRGQQQVAYQASHMIGWFAFEKLILPRLISKVPVGNEAALKFNLHCGFEPIREPDSDYHYLALTQQASRYLPAHRRFRQRRPIEMTRGGQE